MQLSPLQSRLAASAIATILLMLIYFTLFPPQFAFAKEISRASPILLEDSTIRGALLEGSNKELEVQRDTYLTHTHIAAFDPSALVGLAERDLNALTNNVPSQLNLNAGQSLVYEFKISLLPSQRESTSLELRSEPNISTEEDPFVDWEGQVKTPKRTTARTVYISANTCHQPSRNSTTSTQPPQLTLYVSNSTDNTSPGPSAEASKQLVQTFTEGAVMLNWTASDDVYLGVAANNLSSDFSGIYNFEIAASVDTWYHSYSESLADELYWVDSDTTSVLLMTQNLTTNQAQASDPELMNSRPYVMFAQNNEDSSIDGMRYSYCGLNNHAQIAAVRNGQATSQVTTGITRRGAGGFPKQQFYFSGLNASSTYQGILARNANSTTNANVAGGGGHVLRSTIFETKSTHGNCALVFNLTFCDQVAYAVPSNNLTFPDTALLGEFYDSSARSLYDGFNKSLQQIPCEAPDAQQFSLVRNCSTCTVAYKDWLCSMTIPRCEDFSSPDAWLQPRAINETFPDGGTLNADLLSRYAQFQDRLSFRTSRNPLIDQVIKPGPYKEVLPCEDLCYDLVRSCPAALGFACPRPWMTGFNTSYGVKSAASEQGNVTCNYPGSFRYYAGAPALAVPWSLLLGILVALVAP